VTALAGDRLVHRTRLQPDLVIETSRSLWVATSFALVEIKPTTWRHGFMTSSGHVAMSLIRLSTGDDFELISSR